MEPSGPEDKGVLTYWDYQGWRSPVAYVFAAASVFTALLAWSNWNNPMGRDWSGYALALCAVGYFVFAGYLLSRVRRVQINRYQDSISERQGWLIPYWGTDHVLDEFETVQINREYPPH